MNRYVTRLRKYVESPDQGVVRKLVAHCGIALRFRDAARVAAKDPSELERIRDGFCVKRLGLAPQEATPAIDAVCRQMAGDTSKCRVAFYYLLAEKTGRLERLLSPPVPAPTAVNEVDAGAAESSSTESVAAS